MKTVVKIITLLMALVLAGTVAFVSVTGLLKLFAGAGIFGAILFWAMEVSKIVLTFIIHTYSKVIKWYYKGIGVLMIILAMGVTSIGIYGFYSSSYKESFANMTAVENRVALVEEKRDLITVEKESMKEQIDSKRERIKDQSSIRGQQETRMDSLYAKNWYTAARRVQKSIDEANTNITKLEDDIDLLNKDMSVINDSLTSYNLQIIELNQGNSAATELGSLTYLSDVTDMTMDNVMKWFILLIMVLGDPLAVLLVVFFNIINKKPEDKPEVNPPTPDNSTPPLEEVETANKPVIAVDDAANDAVTDAANDAVNEWSTIAGPTRGKLEDKLEDKFDPEPDYWDKEDSEYVMGVDVAGDKPDESVLTVFKKGENDNLEIVQPSESPSELKIEEKNEGVEVEDVMVEKPSESPSESVDVLGEKYEGQIESDKVNRYNVELPEVEKEVNKDFVKGRAVKTDDGVKVKIDEPTEVKKFSQKEKNEVVKEILDKKKMVDRGFSKLIPERDNKKVEEKDKNVFIRKRKNK